MNVNKLWLIWFLIVFSSCFLKAQDDPISSSYLSIQSEKKPLYEFGFFAGSGETVDYPGSDQKHFRWLALPTITYRGDILKSNREEGTKALFFNSEKFELSVSGGGSFPVESKDNQARQGMPNLDWVLELGPKLNFYFVNRQDDLVFYFYIPYRQMFTTDFKKMGEVGYTIAPGFFYQKNHLIWDLLSLYGTLTFNWYDQRANNYFFEVKKTFVKPQRSEYLAKAGYVSTDLSAAISIEAKKNFLIFLGLSLSDYTQSKNTASPLFKEKHNWSYAAGLSYTWLESELKATY